MLLWLPPELQWFRGCELQRGPVRYRNRGDRSGPVTRAWTPSDYAHDVPATVQEWTAAPTGSTRESCRDDRRPGPRSRLHVFHQASSAFTRTRQHAARHATDALPGLCPLSRPTELADRSPFRPCLEHDHVQPLVISQDADDRSHTARAKIQARTSPALKAVARGDDAVIADQEAHDSRRIATGVLELEQADGTLNVGWLNVVRRQLTQQRRRQEGMDDACE